MSRMLWRPYQHSQGSYRTPYRVAMRRLWVQLVATYRAVNASLSRSHAERLMRALMLDTKGPTQMTTTSQIIFDAGKASAKAGINVRKANEIAVEAIKTLNLKLPLNDADSAVLEACRLEYVVGALSSVHKLERARVLADKANAKERSDNDKAILNAAKVNWLNIRTRAGLKDKPAKAETRAEPEQHVVKPVERIAVSAAETTADLVAFFKSLTTAFGVAYGDGKHITGDAGQVLRDELAAMRKAVKEAEARLLSPEPLKKAA